MDYSNFLTNAQKEYEQTTGNKMGGNQMITPSSEKQVYTPPKRIFGIPLGKGSTTTEKVPAHINLEPMLDEYYNSIGKRLVPNPTNTPSTSLPFSSTTPKTDTFRRNFDSRTTPAWKLELQLTREKNPSSGETYLSSAKGKKGLTNDEMLANVYDVKTALGDDLFKEYYPLTSQYLNKDLERRALEYKKQHIKGLVDYGGHEKVPGEEWIRKGVTFGWGSGLPLEEPKTFREKALVGVGQLIPMVMGDYILGGLGAYKAIDSAALKVPGISQAVEKVIPIIQRHPYTWGLLSASGKGAIRGKIVGSVYGALQRPLNRKQWLENINKTGNTFAFFNAIANPLIQFFSPTIQKINEAKFVKSNILPGENTKEVTANKSIYFRLPKNPDYYLKVTPKFAETVKKGSVNVDPQSLPILKEGDVGIYNNSLPQVNEVDVALIKKNKSLAQKLLELVRGKKVPFKVPIESTPFTEVPPTPVGYTPQPSASPEPPQTPVMPTPTPTPTPTQTPKVSFTPKETQYAQKSIEEASSPVVKEIRPVGAQDETILTKLGHPDWIGKAVPKQDYINALKQVGEKTKPISPEVKTPNEIKPIEQNLDKNGKKIYTIGKSIPVQTYQVGITSVEGRTPQEIDKLVEEAKKLEKAGEFDKANLLYGKAVAPGIDTVKKVFPPDGIKIAEISPSIGRYFGETEPTIYTKFTVEPKSEKEFIRKISDLADNGFKQRSVIVHKWVDNSSQYGIIDKDQGLSYEPAVEYFFNKKVELKDNKTLDKLFKKYDLPGATIKPDGSGIEIMNLSAFNKNYEKTNKDFRALARDLDRRKILQRVHYGTKKGWSIGSDNKEALTTYGRIRSILPAKEKPETPEERRKKAREEIEKTSDEHIAKYDEAVKKSVDKGNIILPDKEVEALIKNATQESVFPKGENPEKGSIKVPDILKLKDIWNKAHDWLLTFGDVRRTRPKMWRALMDSYHQRNAGVDMAIDQVKKAVVKNLSTSDAIRMSLIYNNSSLSPDFSPEDNETYNNLAAINKAIEKASIKLGLIKQSFRDRMIAENNVKIQELEPKLKVPKSIKEAQRIKKVIDGYREENKLLSTMRYLPQNIVARRAIEMKLASMNREDRIPFIKKVNRITSTYRKRKGKSFLSDYLKEGILKPEDLDFRGLTAENLSNFYYHSSIKSLYDWAKMNKYIQPATDGLRSKGWLNQREVGIISPELKGQLIHPLLANELAEMKEMQKGVRRSLFGEILSLDKIGQFVKPSIIWVYNVVETYTRGLYSFNPIKEAKILSKSYEEVVEQTGDYDKMNQLGIFQIPYEVSKAAREEKIKLMIRNTSKEVPAFTKKIESLATQTWAGGMEKNASNSEKVREITNKSVLAANMVISNFTWVGDKIQRAASFHIAKEMGMSDKEAAIVVSRAHGAYSEISLKAKKTLSPILFVYSFRFLLPVEMAKIVAEPVIGITDSIREKEKIPRYKWERWIKAIIGAIAIPLTVDTYMKMRGFKVEGKHLGPLAWKYHKIVQTSAGPKELVVGMNYLLNMPIKYWNRFSYYNPIIETPRGMQVAKNVAKWEIHPFWRLFVYDILENKPSFGERKHVYDINASAPEQLWQMATYSFGQSFRIWNGITQAVDRGEVDKKQIGLMKEINKSAFNWMDRMLFNSNWGIVGYSYLRKSPTELKRIEKEALKREYGKRKNIIVRKLRDKDIDSKEFSREKRRLNEWHLYCFKWIKQTYK